VAIEVEEPETLSAAYDDEHSRVFESLFRGHNGAVISGVGGFDEDSEGSLFSGSSTVSHSSAGSPRNVDGDFAILGRGAVAGA
jgi:hypothetical protein